MKHLVLILAFVSFAFGAAHSALGQDWAAETDIPIPPGFLEDEAARLVFDKPGGRMVELHLVGEGEVANLLSFFEDSLSQLGWSETNRGYGGTQVFRIFEREGERLTLTIAKNTAGTAQPLELVLNVEPLSQ